MLRRVITASTMRIRFFGFLLCVLSLIGLVGCGGTHVDTETALGSYNGVLIQAGLNSFSDVFGSDGWVVDSDSDGLFPDVGFVNDSYPNVRLRLYPVDYDAEARVNGSVIESDGFAGYYIRGAAGCGLNMTWNGVTFGATAEQVTQLVEQVNF